MCNWSIGGHKYSSWCPHRRHFMGQCILLATPPVAQRKRETCPGLQVHMAATIKPSDVPDLLLQPFQQKNIQFPYRLFGKSAPVKTDRFRLCGSTEV